MCFYMLSIVSTRQRKSRRFKNVCKVFLLSWLQRDEEWSQYPRGEENQQD